MSAEFIAVPISAIDRAFGLRFHFVRRGVKVEKGRRCKLCFRLLARGDKSVLCRTCHGDWRAD